MRRFTHNIILSDRRNKILEMAFKYLHMVRLKLAQPLSCPACTCHITPLKPPGMWTYGTETTWKPPQPAPMRCRIIASLSSRSTSLLLSSV